MMTNRRLGPEAAKGFDRRLREGYFTTYFSGDAILDIGYRGADPEAEPITEHAVGVDLDFPGYDGKTLPFPDNSQDTILASHVLEHVDDWATALSDWYRVVKIGGYMVIAVPHRDLYERKAQPPSRFGGHKRFYTAASLLSEVERALPVAGYRIRSLKDIDDGFNYQIPPQQHAVGSYEIELIIQKTAIPAYAAMLRPPTEIIENTAFYAMLLCAHNRAKQDNNTIKLDILQKLLKLTPLPPGPLLRAHLRLIVATSEQNKLLDNINPCLVTILSGLPFDETFYISTNPDIALAKKENPAFSPHEHFIRHGYYEGRAPIQL